MKINIYQVDAFTNKLFAGNPAAVCPLNEWLPDELMQGIAMENNLSDTAFLVKESKDYQIRWFTPTTEVALCGHATLAAASVIFNHWGYSGNEINFLSRSGLLKVIKEITGKLTLDFPADHPQVTDDPPSCILEGLLLTGAPVYKGIYDYMVVLKFSNRWKRFNQILRPWHWRTRGASLSLLR